MATTAIAAMIRTVRWALRQPIPAEHRLVLAALATYSNAGQPVVWPSVETVAKLVHLDRATTAWIIQQTEATGLIRLDNNRVELRRDYEIDRTNPLMGLLFRERMTHTLGLSPYERWVCEYLGRMYDWERGVAPASYPHAAQTMAVIRERSRWAWHRAIDKLREERLLEMVHRGKNQNDPSLYELWLPSEDGSERHSLVIPELSGGGISATPELSGGGISATPELSGGGISATPERDPSILRTTNEPTYITTSEPENEPEESQPGPAGRYTDKGEFWL